MNPPPFRSYSNRVCSLFMRHLQGQCYGPSSLVHSQTLPGRKVSRGDCVRMEWHGRLGLLSVFVNDVPLGVRFANLLSRTIW